MTKRLGVTGGIGSGKTTVCRIFRVLGVPVFMADEVARQLMNNDTRLRQGINEVAEKDLYAAGELDRKELARIIFNQPQILSKVNGIVHPAVLDNFEEWVGLQDEPYVIMEAAILFESNADKVVDRVASVTAPVEERIARVMGRSDMTRMQVLERINNQLIDDERNEQSFYVINNSDNEMIIPEILKIHDDMNRLAGRRSNG